jgi:cyclopropane fatty-acyl-phospholipid synthase-like methyltransferase
MLWFFNEYLPNIGVTIVSHEFYDLSEKLLNSKNQYWGNLGYWQTNNDYSSACRALADELALAVQLNEFSNVFDAGFGSGDQLLLWLKKYKVNSIQGLNYSKSQTALAQKRLDEYGFSQAVNSIKYGSVTEMNEKNFSNAADDINKVVALDCAYHFPSRIQFLTSSYQKLNKGGRIGLTDILVSDSHTSSLQRLALRAMLFLSSIPAKNIVTLNTYKDELSKAGFENISIRDISDHVFTPFSDWLYEFKKGEGALRSKSKLTWLKYDVTAKFLKWAYRNNILRYAIITADKPTS